MYPSSFFLNKNKFTTVTYRINAEGNSLKLNYYCKPFCMHKTKQENILSGKLAKISIRHEINLSQINEKCTL